MLGRLRYALGGGRHRIVRRSGLFDAAYYLAQNPDVGKAGEDPLAHYLRTGWREGRNPSASFDISHYLRKNPDVQAAGLEPLCHYVLFGMAEGRSPLPEPGAPNAAEAQPYQIPLEPWHLQFIDALTGRIDLRSCAALEIGCGRGEVARAVIRRVDGVRIEGIDSDLCGLADTRDETADRLAIRTMDVTNMGFPDGRFEAVYSLNVFEHVGDIPGAYREIRRVLKPGGMVFISVSPVWSSYRGHHFNHWLPDYVNLIPPWGHLCQPREGFAEGVRRKMGDAVAEEAVRYVFDSEYLNRCTIRDHERFARESGMEVVEFLVRRGYEGIERPAAATVVSAAAKAGLTPEEIEVDGFSLLMRKEVQ